MIQCLTQIQAAALLRVSPRTLRDWPDAPRNKDGTYSGPDLVAYYLAKLRGSDDDFGDQKQRLAAAQAEKVETENALRRGDLLVASAVVEEWSSYLLIVRERLLAIPTRLASISPEDQRARVHDLAKELVYEALTELSHWGTEDTQEEKEDA